MVKSQTNRRKAYNNCKKLYCVGVKKINKLIEILTTDNNTHIINNIEEEWNKIKIIHEEFNEKTQ